MTRYAIRRILLTIPTLLGVTIVVFLFVRLIPGDPVQAMLRESASPEAVAEIRERMGLNRPVYEQYVIFMVGNDVTARLRYATHWITGHPIPMPVVNETYRGILRGDLGRSLARGNLIITEFRHRFPATIELAVTALIFGMLVGIPIGILSAIKRGTLVDAASMTVALVGVSTPIYWLGLMAIMLFAVTLHWVPTGTRLGVDIALKSVTNFNILDSLISGNLPALWDSVRHIILPALVLGTWPMAVIARITRSSMLEVLRQDYVRTARAKGLTEWVVIFRHALKNALLPVITVIGLEIGVLFSGAVLTESIFAWPGVGRWLFESISFRDYTVIQAGTLAIAAAYVVANLIVDLSYAVIDPRIRYH